LVGLIRVGVRDIRVVDGDRAEELRDALALHELACADIEVLSAPTAQRACGASALLAHGFVDRPCLIVRGDRPLDDEALAALANTDLDGDAAAIVVSPAPDPECHPQAKLYKETKVLVGEGRDEACHVVAIGPDLETYDGVFTGHLLASPALFAELARLPNPRLDDGLAALARSQRVRVLLGQVAWPWRIERAAPVDRQVEALLDTKAHPRYHLLNPGPVNTTARVKSALVHHDVCHRDASFSELMISLTGKLRRIFRASPEHTIALITGSGTAAMECALSSTVPRDRKVLVIDNGAFGERLAEICRVHDMDLVHLRYAWGDLVDPADVERLLQDHPDIAVVAMIHHETSVGLLNPVAEIGGLCRRYDALLIVDAVSSLGAEDLDVVRDNVDVCYSSANKCLHAISGAGFLCVAPRVWRRIEHLKPRSYYLDLNRYRRYAEELAQTPFTPAVSAYFALDAACSEFLADGHRARFELYRRRNQRLREGLAQLGMAPFTRTGWESNSVVTCCVPAGMSFAELYSGLKARGYIIYGCKDVLADRFLQIANMGDLDDSVIDEFLAELADVIDSARKHRALARREPVTVRLRARA
jgi:2-aminoethylphosphonate-pyruvate transaminase